MRAHENGFHIRAREPAGVLQEELFDLGGSHLSAGLLLHGAQHGQALFAGVRVEQRDVLFGAALALQVHREQVGAAG